MPSPERKCENGLIRTWLEYTQDQESPQDFHIWALITATGYCMGRKCYYDFRRWKVYPNIYLVLVGDSATTKKSTALDLSLDLVHEALRDGANISDQKLTPEYMIQWLSEKYEETGVSHGLVYADEFSTFLGNVRLDDSLLKILTALWDCKKYWSYGTKMHGKTIINNGFLSLMGGTTVNWLRSSVPEEAWEAGFFSRLLLVARPPRGKPKSDPRKIFPPEREHLYHNVVHDLRKISRIEGEYKMTPDAERAREEWYETQLPLEMAKAPQILKSYFGRKDKNLIAVAMVIAASLRDERIITLPDYNVAMMIVNQNEEFFENLNDQIHISKEGKDKLWLQGLFEKYEDVSRSQLINRCTYRFGTWDRLGPVLEMLLHEGIVEQYEAKRHKAIRYRLVKQGNTK